MSNIYRAAALFYSKHTGLKRVRARLFYKFIRISSQELRNCMIKCFINRGDIVWTGMTP